MELQKTNARYFKHNNYLAKNGTRLDFGRIPSEFKLVSDWIMDLFWLLISDAI